MKKTLILVAIMLLVASMAYAASVVGSKHDLRAGAGGTATGTGLTEVCVVCHTPHMATAAQRQMPLWNHNVSTNASFGVYSNATMNGVPTNIGGAAIGSQSVSMLCMGCHDGTMSVLNMYNPPNANPVITVTAIANRINASGAINSNSGGFIGTDLRDDHPVNFTYNTALATADGGLYDPAATPAVNALLFAGSVQCGSCHDVHDPANTPFLRMANTASALCLTCHNK